MKISYIVNARIPTEKAHGFQICKMCETFSDLGNTVELIVPERDNHINDSAFGFYKLKDNFEIKKIKIIDFLKYENFFGKFSIYFLSIFYLFKLFFLNLNKQAIIYTRNPEIVWLFKIRGFKVVYEAHSWPESKTELYKFFLKKVDLIVCNSGGTEKKYKDNFKKTIVATNGVDLEEFDLKESKNSLRRKVGLEQDKKIVMYVGHLYEWKGVDVVFHTAELMKEKKEVLFVFVGGTKGDVMRYQNKANEKELKNVLFLGHKRKEFIPKFLKSADVLVLPNVPISQESSEFTSPIKMFEYMASEKPIIASSLPSIKEVLSESNSLLFKPGNAIELKRKIEKIFSDRNLYTVVSLKAFEDVKQHTWKRRAEKILNNIE